MAYASGLSMGYGVPSPNDDKWSTLGTFWYKIFKGDHKKTDIAIRITVGAIKAIPFIVIPILSGKWALYAIVSVLAIAVNGFIGGYWHPRQMITVFKKKLLLEKFLIYFGETLLYQILIWI